MAIIKCPECGHQVSDKAPLCPQCGVEIYGKIVRCPQCGDIYFQDQQVCPNCHYAIPGTLQQKEQSSSSPEETNFQTPQMENSVPPSTLRASIPVDSDTSVSQKRKKSGYATAIIATILTIIVCSACFYFYKNAKDKKEMEAYEYAMRSSDLLVLQSFLDNYPDAPSDHRDAVLTHLTTIKQIDSDWTDAVISNSKSALKEYLSKHPDSPHKAEALNKIDSIDWVRVSGANTIDAYKSYLEDHPNGNHADDAKEQIQKINAQTVQPEEKQMITTLFRRFFQSINTKDEDGMLSHVNDVLTSFLGKSDADKGDVVTFMHKIYKEDVVNMNWLLPGDYKIEKKEIGEQRYEYGVTFSANQEIEHVDGTNEKFKYHVKAKVNPDGKITEMNMKKILE